MKYFLPFLTVLLASCSNNSGQSKWKALNEVFTTSNWRQVSEGDTSYIFFSQLAGDEYETIQYKLFQGDTIESSMGFIREKEGRITWKWHDEEFALKHADENKFVWQDESNEYVFKKLSDSFMVMTNEAMEIRFSKTLPLSTFLIRARYDYLHNTRLADSAEVPPRSVK